MNNDIEKLKRVRELLVTIDMVNGFVKEGSLAAPSIMRVVPRQVELLKNIPDVGDIIAKSIVDYFNEEKNKELISKDRKSVV